MTTAITLHPMGEQSFRYLQTLCRIGAYLSIGLLTACAHQPTMYSWDSYQPAVYAYLQGDQDPAASTEAMEKNVEIARAQNAVLPPGFHAHLGLLYLQQGQDARAIEQIQSEKAAFPESAVFMDFLLRKTKEPSTTNESNGVPDNKQTQSTSTIRTHNQNNAEQPS